MENYPLLDITGLILAGGRASRMEGIDKGLIVLNNKPMISYVIERLRPQVSTILINANRNISRYAQYGYPVITDALGDFQGPLAGMASGLEKSTTQWMVTCPCDGPLILRSLVAHLYNAVLNKDSNIAVAHDGNRLQPVYALLHRDTLPSLQRYLQSGGRKIDQWLILEKFTTVDFSRDDQAFINVNTPDELQKLEQQISSLTSNS